MDKLESHTSKKAAWRSRLLRNAQSGQTIAAFLPSSPFLGALAYIRERRVGLSVHLDDPEV